MLEEEGVDFRYRDYRKEPLTLEELRETLRLLDMSPVDVLRKRDRAAVDLGLTGRESDETLLELMAQHPTLLQRPIGVLDDRAVVGRPVNRLLELQGA